MLFLLDSANPNREVLFWYHFTACSPTWNILQSSFIYMIFLFQLEETELDGLFRKMGLQVSIEKVKGDTHSSFQGYL